MEEYEYQSVAQMKGSLSQKACPIGAFDGPLHESPDQLQIVHLRQTLNSPSVNRRAFFMPRGVPFSETLNPIPILSTETWRTPRKAGTVFLLVYSLPETKIQRW